MSSINVGMMTSGGLAPCLSSSVAYLIQYWSAAKKSGQIADLTIRMYRNGYKGLLVGDSFLVPEEVWDQVDALHDLGGSPIGNSRVKVRLYFFNRVSNPVANLSLLFANKKTIVLMYLFYSLRMSKIVWHAVLSLRVPAPLK